MLNSRRTFLKCIGTAAATLAVPTIGRSQNGPSAKLNPRTQMQITKAGSQPSTVGPADWFTGTVRIDPQFPVKEPARAAGNTVTFEPGARTAWHTHPLGQALIVTAGVVGPSSGAVPSRKSVRATWSGSRRARSTGTGPDRPRQ